MSMINKLLDSYVIWHAKRIKLVHFTPSSIIRKKVTFSGKVQKVGFRLEIYVIAERLNLTGWVRNLEDGSVEAELQGEETKVNFLIHCMQSLKRASVEKLVSIDMPISDEEKDFRIIK